MVKQQWRNIHIQFCETSNIILQKKHCVGFGFRALLRVLAIKYSSSTKAIVPKPGCFFPYLVVSTQIRSSNWIIYPTCLGWREECQKIFENHLEPHFLHPTFVPTFRHHSGHGTIYKITRLNPTTSLAFRLFRDRKSQPFKLTTLKNRVDQPIKHRTKKQQSLNKNRDDIFLLNTKKWFEISA